jgi:MFS family permease
MTTRPWRVLALLSTAFFMTVLDGTSLLAALPSVERALHLAGHTTPWLVTAYALAFSGPLLLCGRAADLLGRRRMFLAGMALRVLASLWCGFAGSGEALVAARALQGLSAAIIAPAALSMVMNAFPEGAARNKALGVWGGVGGFGATAGLLLGGLLTDTLGWQWVFWVNVPVGAAVLALAPALLRESRSPAPARRFDLAGALTVTAALVLLVYALTLSSSRSLRPAAGAAALLVLFVLIERRAAAPLVPPRLFRSRTLVGGNLLVLAGGMAVDGMLITLTAYTQQTLGWSAARFGLLAAAMTVASIGGALAGQRCATALGVRPVAVTGTILLAAACALLALGFPTLMPLALVAFGTGIGAAFACAQIAALGGVAEADSGLAAGLVDTSFAIGTSLGVAICSSVTLAGAGTGAAFGVAGLFAACGLVAALILLGSRRTETGSPAAPTPTRAGAKS